MMVKKQKKNLLTRFGVMGLMIAGAMLLAACQPAAQAADQSTQAQGFGGGNGQRPNFQMQPATELPTTQTAVRGFLVSHNGDSLVVQIGNPNFRQGQGNGPRPTPNGTPRVRPTIVGSGTDVTVTVTSDTVIYQDVTFASLSGQQPPSGTIQQKVEKSNLDALTGNERVTIWGDQNGDQITAKVIVYNQFRGGQPQQQAQPQQS